MSVLGSQVFGQALMESCEVHSKQDTLSSSNGNLPSHFGVQSKEKPACPSPSPLCSQSTHKNTACWRH